MRCFFPDYTMVRVVSSLNGGPWCRSGCNSWTVLRMSQPAMRILVSFKCCFSLFETYNQFIDQMFSVICLLNAITKMKEISSESSWLILWSDILIRVMILFSSFCGVVKRKDNVEDHFMLVRWGKCTKDLNPLKSWNQIDLIWWWGPGNSLHGLDRKAMFSKW